MSAGLFAVWCIEHREELRIAAAQTTAHGELADIGVAMEGNHVYLLLEFTTGDASGQTKLWTPLRKSSSIRTLIARTSS